MTKIRKSLFEELNSIAITKDKDRIMEQKAENIIASAINLMEYIRSNYEEEVAADLNKRLVNSIRTQDPKKFKRGLPLTKK
jgi:hypothetical protein